MEIQNGRFKLIGGDLTEKDFKTEWTRIEHEGVRALLDQMMSAKFNEPMNADSLFGFAWTSSGRFSQLGVTDPRITINGNRLQAFLIRYDGVLVAHCFSSSESEEEDDIFYEVE